MKLVKTKGAFITKAHHAVSRKAGEIFEISDEDYEEVKDMCELVGGNDIVEAMNELPKKKKKE